MYTLRIESGAINYCYPHREQMQDIYLLKDLSKISGHSIYTLKYYLNLGLITEVGRSPCSNFRFFDDTTVVKLKKIREMQLKNMSLKDIKSLLVWEGAQ